MTAYDLSDIEKEARDTGVTLFWKKPIFVSEIKKYLIDATNYHDLERKSETNLKYNVEDISGKRILVAEDQPLNRIILERLLVDKEIIVELAEDGLIALNWI